jgi:hypothetical protein
VYRGLTTTKSTFARKRKPLNNRASPIKSGIEAIFRLTIYENWYISVLLLILMSLPGWAETAGKGGRRLSGGKNGTELHVPGSVFE